MKDIFYFGGTLLFMWCSQMLSNVPSSNWLTCLYICCTFLAAILGNYIINWFYPKIINFFDNVPYLAFPIGLIFAAFPAGLFLIYHLTIKKMYDFPFVLLWTLFAAIIANYLISKLPFTNDEEKNSLLNR